MLEIIQAENPDARRDIESGRSKRVKVFVDIAWDADAYDKWKREEEVRSGIAMTMMQEQIPPNFMSMSEEDRDRYFRENWEKNSASNGTGKEQNKILWTLMTTPHFSSSEPTSPKT